MTARSLGPKLEVVSTQFECLNVERCWRCHGARHAKRSSDALTQRRQREFWVLGKMPLATGVPSSNTTVAPSARSSQSTRRVSTRASATDNRARRCLVP
jgi:hypothetical protein